MSDCIFCKIVAGKESAHVVYEDDELVAFLDVSPINPGHTLVVPRVHESEFYNLNQSLYAHTMEVVRRIGKRISAELDPLKVGVIVAGFDVPHAHIHVLPMHSYHDITSKSILEGTRSSASSEELRAVAEKLHFS